MRSVEVWLCDVLDDLVRLIGEAWDAGRTPRAIVLDPTAYRAVASAQLAGPSHVGPLSLLGFEVTSSENAADGPRLVFER